MSTNPFLKHTSTMFGTRGCDIDQALVYANDVISAMPVEVQSHAMTALMVVVNTASNAWTQASGPSPERIALMELIQQQVVEWMSNNLDGKLDEWVNNSLSFEDACDNRIERWIENNLDISDQLESAINDMDLVVRVR